MQAVNEARRNFTRIKEKYGITGKQLRKLLKKARREVISGR